VRPGNAGPKEVGKSRFGRRIKLTHKDPGDRFIAATALVYDLVLVTADRELLQCPALKTV
jgi:PIN domain nuclease of toxin-antitoxin system